MLNLDAGFKCAVCGSAKFSDHEALWPEVLDNWELPHEEAMVVKHHHATHCDNCQTPIRFGALAKGICMHFKHHGTFHDFILNQPNFTVLEINEAGTLHKHLSQLPGHVFCGYPQCDLNSLKFKDNSFSLVVHSDTLEHVPDPQLALSEVLRVLEPEGVTLFTIPIVQGRLNRSRASLPKNYRGPVDETRPEAQVNTEFGADLWCMVLEAGFKSCDLIAYPYPSGIAVLAKK
jgi:SAM-dependent methyltransferase